MPVWIKVNNGIEVPRDTGATDLEDSARLAGMMAIARMYPLPSPECYIGTDASLRRWLDSELPFTRDQLLPLASFFREIRSTAVLAEFIMLSQILAASKGFLAPNGKDPLLPHHRAHLGACLDSNWTWLGKLFLTAEIYWHAFHEGGVSEPNQLMCMLFSAGDSWVAQWRNTNANWEESINRYWCGWRNEPELARLLKERVKSCS